MNNQRHSCVRIIQSRRVEQKPSGQTRPTGYISCEQISHKRNKFISHMNINLIFYFEFK